MSRNRQWISLGGWCGPSLILSKLGRTTHQTQMPFDMVRCTLDGIAEFTKLGFGEGGANFFPRPNEHGVFVPDPVSIWLLFRGWHTAFTHYDLNRPIVRNLFLERMDRWSALFHHPPPEQQQQQQQEKKQVIFLRTSISENPLAEMRFVPLLQKIFDEASNHQLDHRFVLVHHQLEQAKETKPLCFIDDAKRAVIWTLAHDLSVPQDASLFDKSDAAYTKIVESCETDDGWAKLQKSSLPVWGGGGGDVSSSSSSSSSSSLTLPDGFTTPSRLLSHVEGISTFRGTCAGFGSTESQALGEVCLTCGDGTGHALKEPTLFDTGKPWTEEEEEQLAVIQLQFHLSGEQGDVVQKVEEAANLLKRGANETLQKFREMGMPMQF